MFNFRILNDFPKIAAFWENPEKNWSNLAKNSAKIQQILANFATFCKNQQKIQQFSTKKLRLENGAKECKTVQRSALCRSRRELSNEYLLAKFGFDTAENEPI